MRSFKPTGFILAIALLLSLILAACGPANPTGTGAGAAVDAGEPATGETRTDETGADETRTGETSDAPADAAGAATALEVDPATIELDNLGIQVGFTVDGNPYRGDPGAPITIEEYSDFQCPFCTRFTEQTFPTLLDNQVRNGEVVFVFYDFPLESIHPQARAAANAAHCAGAQGAVAYWEMHDILFANAEAWSISDPAPVFRAYAENLGLDTEQFATCLTEQPYDAQVQTDIDRALARGIRSTPSFLLNGQPLIGAQPVEAFNSAIAAVLSGEALAAEPEPQQQLPLEPPRVAPTPAAVPLVNPGMALGDPDAPVTIVEFTDYQCPFCQRHALETLPGIIANLVETGDVYYVMKDLPLDSIHPEARSAANAARCAGEQDAYLPVHDAIFERQTDWAGQGATATAVYLEIATEAGLDLAEFERCLNEERYAADVEANVQEALALGVQSTPAFFINGMPVPGAQPYELFAYAVALAKEGTLADAYAVPEPDLSNAYALGDPNAPVTIIEYTDYQCPFCSRHFLETFGQIRENYIETGQVYYIFKDFPLTSIHPQAFLAAEAARCAGDQDGYVAMHDRLFTDQAEWNGRDDAAEIFVTYAADLGLDADTFRGCLESGQHTAAVQADLEEGGARGISGTPSFVINGYTMSGAYPYAMFEQAIKQFLNES